MADGNDDAIRVGNAGNVTGNQPFGGVQHQTQATEVARYVLGGATRQHSNTRQHERGGVKCQSSVEAGW